MGCVFLSLDISKSSAMAHVATSHNFHGLPVEIVKKIAWAAMEPTPTARIISNLRMTYEDGLSEWVALVVTHPSNCGPDWSDLRQYWPRRNQWKDDGITLHRWSLESSLRFDWRKCDVIRDWQGFGVITKAWWKNELEQDRLSRILEDASTT